MSSAFNIREFRETKKGHKLESVLEYTAIVAEAASLVFEAVPGVGLIFAAARIGAKLMSPPSPKKSDLERQFNELKETIDNTNSQTVKDACGLQLRQVQEKLKVENDIHFSLIRRELQEAFGEVSKTLHEVESNLSKMKVFVEETYYMVLDQSHKEGLEKLDAAYQVFLDGSHDMKGTMAEFDGFMAELQTLAIQTLKPEKISNYLKILSTTKNKAEMQEMFEYIITVRAKYLILVVSFYAFRNNVKRVEGELEKFNQFFEEIKKLHEEFVKTGFKSKVAPEAVDSAKPIEAKVGDKKLEEFLINLDLIRLYPKLRKEDFEFEMLVDCTESDMISLGLTYGERRKLWKAIEDLKITEKDLDSTNKPSEPSDQSEPSVFAVTKSPHSKNSTLETSVPKRLKVTSTFYGGIYELQPKLINDRHHWIRGNEAIWYHHGSWRLGSQGSIGTSVDFYQSSKFDSKVDNDCFPDSSKLRWRYRPTTLLPTYIPSFLSDFYITSDM